MIRRSSRRLLPPPGARELYGRAAKLQAGADRLAAERESRRIQALGDSIAAQVEARADRQIKRDR